MVAPVKTEKIRDFYPGSQNSKRVESGEGE